MLTPDNVILMIAAVILSFVSLVAIRFQEVKSVSTIKEKLKVLPMASTKGNIYIIAMFVLNIVLTVVLISIYKEHSLLFQLKRIMLISILWVAACYDYKSYRIPNKLIILGLAYRGLILGAELIWGRENLLMTVVSEVIAAVALVFLSVVCLIVMKGCFGMGDIKLFIVMALFQGVVGITSSVFMSLVVSFFISVSLLITKKKTRKDAIPFAPSILIGTFVSIFMTGA